MYCMMVCDEYTVCKTPRVFANYRSNVTDDALKNEQSVMLHTTVKADASSCHVIHVTS